jgi:succinyl-CoA synthetase beta subunit
MNLHEYQAKNLFAEYNIPAPKGIAITSLDQLDDALEKLGGNVFVIKSQIHAGGRGKGHFDTGFEGGVKLAQSREQAREFAAAMLGHTLITKQTGPTGRKVQNLYITEPVDVAKEFYLALAFNRQTSAPTLILSAEGGTSIEEIAREHPKSIVRIEIDPLLGLRAHQARTAADKLGLEGNAHKQTVQLLLNLYRLYIKKELSLVEINPLALTREGQIVALDAKASVEDNALFRHPELAAARDTNEEDSKETQARTAGLSYIALEGNIACMVNGAGLAMSTMDIIAHHGGAPANFLDVGGSADVEQVDKAFEIILSDPKVKVILVNIFGGIMRCDTIAQGILEAAGKVHLTVPLVVRLEGTNVDAGRKMLAESGLKLHSASSLDEAAQKAVELAQK